MITRIFIALAVLSGTTSADQCSCYRTATYTGVSAPINNAYNPDDFTACYPTAGCSFIADTAVSTKGWSNLVVTWPNGAQGTDGKLVIYDGQDSNALPLLTVPAGTNVAAGDNLSLIKSSSQKIFIQYTQTGNTPVVYYGVIKAVDGLAVRTDAPTTTTIPTTRAYKPTDFKRDPYFITHDLLIAVNPKTSQGVTGLNAINTLASSLASQLSVTTDVNSDGMTRLALASITPYQPYASILGQIWGMNSTDVQQNLPQAGQSSDGNLNEALKYLATLAFNVTSTSTDDHAITRRNAQRTIILFTADWPAANADLTIQDDLSKLGVNLVVIGYKLTDQQVLNIRGSSQWFNVKNLQAFDTPALASFVNPFFFNDQSEKNFWCPTDNTAIVRDDTNPKVSFNEPINYNGAKEFSSTWAPFVGQIARYCNFQDRTYTITNYDSSSTAPPKTVKLTVFYELEIERDYLRVYDDKGREIESFTGNDVTGAVFYSTAPSLTARFTTDNKVVYGGFSVSVEFL